MTKKAAFGNRFVQEKEGVIGPVPPRQRTFVPKALGDYPKEPPAYLEVAEMFGSKALRGSGLCDELMDLVHHMFTEEEATLVRHIKPGLRTCTADFIAELEQRTIEEVRRILDRLTDEKRILMSAGSGDKKAYFILPLLPGIFERALVTTSLENQTEWQRRFAVIFEKYYETGFSVSEIRASRPAGVRYLPVGQTIETHSMALPSDKLEEVFAPYKIFAVGLCQCRIAEEAVGRYCGRPMEVCTVMGAMAEGSIASGTMRQVELKELLEIKAEAEASGLVNWTMNVDPSKGGSNTSCSCCGCCCHAMRAVSEFSMPARISPPHFLPVHYSNKCSHCGKCALACPMGAITVDVKNKAYQHNRNRCVGCGQCVVACSKEMALSMDAVPGYELPGATSTGGLQGL